MDLELTGAHAVVTGASKGIGLAITRALVREGAGVLAVARSSSPELETLRSGYDVDVLELDLEDASAADRVLHSTGGVVDILVNNVGAVFTRTQGFFAISDEDWARSISLNLMVAVRMTRTLLPLMIERGDGVIVNTSSVNAVLPDPPVLDYSAAKAALSSFAKSISKEYGPQGIRVVSVEPGPVATDLWLGDHGVAQQLSAVTGAEPDAVAAAAVAGTATGRFTRPEEVADLVVFLASPRAGNVTGSSVVIDGGLIPTL